MNFYTWLFQKIFENPIFSLKIYNFLHIDLKNFQKSYHISSKLHAFFTCAPLHKEFFFPYIMTHGYFKIIRTLLFERPTHHPHVYAQQTGQREKAEEGERGETLIKEKMSWRFCLYSLRGTCWKALLLSGRHASLAPKNTVTATGAPSSAPPVPNAVSFARSAHLVLQPEYPRTTTSAYKIV